VYICSVYLSYCAPMSSTYITVSSRLVVKGGCTCEIKSLGPITSCWVGQNKQGGYKIGVIWQRAQSNPRMRPGWTYSQGAARDSHSSMYKMYIDYDVVIHLEKKKKKIKVLCIACMTNCLLLCDWFVCFLCRLKINHDSHEFVLEFGTVANSKEHFNSC
jgi:hypothetical protein